MKKIFIFMLIGCIICIERATIVEAEENPMNFQVNLSQSEYQIDKQKNYFDLKLPEMKKIALSIELENMADKSIMIEAEINNATTNLNGVVEYGSSDDKLKGAPFDLKKVVKLTEKKFELAPMSKKIVNLEVEVPTIDYDGVVAGGLTFRDITKKEEKNIKEGSMFTNRFGYAIAIVLHGAKPPVPSNIVLDSVAVTQLNGRNAISAELVNKTANYLNNVIIDSVLKDKNGKEIFNEKKENMQLAPNSIFKFPLLYKEQKIEPGEYELELNIKSNDESWKLKRKFTIEKSQAETYNKSDVIQANKAQETNKLMGIIILLSVLLLIFIIIGVSIFIYHWKK